MKRFFFLFGLIAAGCLLEGCATPNYFPLKNPKFSQQDSKSSRNVVVFPFEVGVQYEPFATQNSQAKAVQKSDEAETYALDALKEELLHYGYTVTDYVTKKEFRKDDLEEDERLIIMAEILNEYQSASYSIRDNLMEEKGKDFDYSVGIRVQELNRYFSPPPDVYALVYVDGYVQNLVAFEQNSFNTVEAILSLGMSQLGQTANDVLSMDLVLIDAKTGDILWLNNYSRLARSILVPGHIHEAVKQILASLNKSQGSQ